jgi:hypothetical protein
LFFVIESSGIANFCVVVSFTRLTPFPETFDARDGRMLVWMQLRLDQKAWREAVKIQRNAVRKLDRVYKSARVRLAEAGEPEGGMLGTYAVFLFESPPPKPKPNGEDGKPGKE